MNLLDVPDYEERQLCLQIVEKLEYPLGLLKLLNDTNLFSDSLKYAIEDLQTLTDRAAQRLKN